MSFLVATRAGDPESADDWPLPSRPPFMTSATLERLEEDLDRYVRGEVAGRSYLIAGHRGAGKTALVLRAIENLRYRRLQAALQPDADTGAQTAPQRPLLVKLHGPSLLEPLTEGEESQDPIARAKAVAHEALVQITISLYRQLAAELASGFAIKAGRFKTSPSVGGAELAGQLQLDLDGGADPAALRSYWRRIQRLDFGVLWPGRTDQLLIRLGATHQGLKEIIALTTASQAYRICTGQVTQSIDDNKNLKAAAETKAEGDTNLAEAVGRLGALAAGGLTGAVLWPDASVALGAGVLVWLLGSISLKWTFTLTRSRDRIDNYKFLPNKNVETLDRDLPLVIQRVRDAGLAPIFVIDELDKLATPADEVAQIIGRLKHIIADFGFFCFLTDRGYFDYVDQKLQAEAYATEHTYFSERRLLIYSPAAVDAYLDEILVLSSPPTANDALAKQLLRLALTHQSRLNLTELNRGLRRLADEKVLDLSSDELLRRDGLRLPAALQLAIDDILRRPGLAERIRSDPGFAHLAYDALYAISEAWAREDVDYDATRKALTALLGKRIDKAKAQSRIASTWTLGKRDLEAIADAHAALVQHLGNFGALARVVGALDPNSALPSLIPSTAEAPSLLIPISGRSGCYRIAYDAQGQPRAGEMGPIDPDEASRLASLIAEFKLMLHDLQIDLPGLFDSRLLPLGPPMEILTQAQLDLEIFAVGTITDDAARPSWRIARTFETTLNDFGPRLSAGLSLARKLQSATRTTLWTCLLVLGRYPVLGPPVPDPTWSAERWGEGHELYTGLAASDLIRGQPDAIKAFKKQLLTLNWGTEVERSAVAKIVEDLWAQRFVVHFAGGQLNPEEFRFSDLMSCAMGVGLSANLRPDLDQLSVGDWSRFARVTLRNLIKDGSPLWPLIAALRKLRFRGAVLLRLTEAPGPGDQNRPIEVAARQFAEQAPEGVGGLAVVYDGLEPDDPIPSEGPAQFYVPRGEVASLEVGLDWLTDHGAFEGKADERQDPLP